MSDNRPPVQKKVMVEEMHDHCPDCDKQVWPWYVQGTGGRHRTQYSCDCGWTFTLHANKRARVCLESSGFPADQVAKGGA